MLTGYSAFGIHEPWSVRSSSSVVLSMVRSTAHTRSITVLIAGCSEKCLYDSRAGTCRYVTELTSDPYTRGGRRVPEFGPLGFVRGALSNELPYRD
jgi:hypothetical protein